MDWRLALVMLLPLLVLSLACGTLFISWGWSDAVAVLTFTLVGLGLSAPGTVTAIVGDSGSGKPTLARPLLRYAGPDSGSITLGGVALEQVAPDTLHSTVGAVFQDARLLRAPIAENIALPDPTASRARIEDAARAAHIHDRILRLPRGYDSVSRGYDSVFSEDADLSGGEAQRVCVARTLLLDPPVLLLDEPTASADAGSEHTVQTALSALLTPERTVIVIAHRLDTATGADQILVLDRGRIVERGTHTGLLAANGRYADHWRLLTAAKTWRFTPR